MISPFPGMDPYLEDPAFWPDFHQTFINYGREAIAERLPDQYDARVNERILLEDSLEETTRVVSPDVSNHKSGEDWTERPAASGSITLEPTTIPLLILDHPRQTFIEIYHRPERALVTVFELLSPANKTGGGRAAYLEKRNALILQDVHLFELDLLLGGRRLPLQGSLPPGDYYAFISRADRRPECDVFAWPVTQPLPTLPVPLRAPDPDVLLDLAAVFATTFERGRYARSLPYNGTRRSLGRRSDSAGFEGG